MRNWTMMMVAALMLGGCASNGGGTTGEAVASSDPETEVICRRVKKLGSNFTETVCKTRAEMDQEREQAGETMRRERDRMQRSTIENSRNSGG